MGRCKITYKDELDDYDVEEDEEIYHYDPISSKIANKPARQNSSEIEAIGSTSLHSFLQNLNGSETQISKNNDKTAKLSSKEIFKDPSHFGQIISFPFKEKLTVDSLQAKFSKKQNQEIFKFDTPSPDDLVSMAQKNADAGRVKAKGSATAVMKDLAKMDITENGPISLKQTKSPSMNQMQHKLTLKSQLNLIVAGHVDAGKSTLLGHLLFLAGEVPAEQLKKYERDSKASGMGSFSFAWIMDSTDTERQRGVTIDISVGCLVTPNYRVSLMDAPGHKDFIPNMISGASRAEAAILVVDASPGEFETGLANQTKEHALLLRSLGIQQIIIAVNKMDRVNWSMDRFNEVQQKMTSLCRLLRLDTANIRFVPVSGLKGLNLTTKFEDCQWYQGECLLNLIDSIKVPKRAEDSTFRFTLYEVQKEHSNILLVGIVDSGRCTVGDTLLLLPIQKKIYVKGE